MEFLQTELAGLVVCNPKVYYDERGYFSEVFKKEELEKFLGFEVSFDQDNESKSTFGVVRGLHYQKGIWSQSKLIRVIQGEILDVVVDMRKSSETFGHTFSILLNDENKTQLFVPKGFAHGYAVLSEVAIVSYKVDAKYAPESEAGVSYLDKTLNIDWKLKNEDIIVSEKDLVLPEFNQAVCFEEELKFYE
ncbi:dTDP-4-dehydrorhamnose 3,5-epimerase [Flavicella sediminum]|uniref:dTDP-4-dehydrorhamnose 3,5-epimerase n=1 Tax=Flavicella sediminum TaxID=2585141 RepID=UPI001120AD3D|nr:dTDP-4-dehydrorhamnose 3,5-epimerase [Flavicella sediminum]